MTVTFKTLKYKHYKQAVQLQDEASNGLDMLDFVFSLVKDWDFVDEETGDKVVDKEDLSSDQLVEVIQEFNTKFKAIDPPKASA